MSALGGFHVGLLSLSNWNLKMLVLRRAKNQRTWRKTLGARTRTNNKHNPHMTPSWHRTQWCAVPASLSLDIYQEEKNITMEIIQFGVLLINEYLFDSKHRWCFMFWSWLLHVGFWSSCIVDDLINRYVACTSRCILLKDNKFEKSCKIFTE